MKTLLNKKIIPWKTKQATKKKVQIYLDHERKIYVRQDTEIDAMIG